MTTPLHIVSFDVPYPPDYGGVIDVFHKIKALSALGVKIYLHCFAYNRKPAQILTDLCEEVFYYPRKPFVFSRPFSIPYITSSRQNELLLQRLSQNQVPILFEGLHTCFYLNHPLLTERVKVVRMHNIEADYYQYLSQNERNLFKKLYYRRESLRLRQFETVLQHATEIAAISSADKEYFSAKWGNKVWQLPVFHGNEQLTGQTGKGTYAFYHGNLSVNENSLAAMFLVQEVFNQLPHQLIIAGKNPPDSLRKAIARQSNCLLYPNPSADQMTELMQQAHVHVLPTFQPTGIKLKLLNALYQGRFCLVNPEMVAGTELNPLCHLAQTPQEFTQLINDLFNQAFTTEHIHQREAILDSLYSDAKNGQLLLERIENA